MQRPAIPSQCCRGGIGRRATPNLSKHVSHSLPCWLPSGYLLRALVRASSCVLGLPEGAVKYGAGGDKATASVISNPAPLSSPLRYATLRRTIDEKRLLSVLTAAEATLLHIPIAIGLPAMQLQFKLVALPASPHTIASAYMPWASLDCLP